MHVYLYQGASRRQSLIDDLNALRVTPVEIGPAFFRADLRMLNRDGHENHAFLLMAGPDLVTHVLKLRRAGEAVAQGTRDFPAAGAERAAGGVEGRDL